MIILHCQSCEHMNQIAVRAVAAATCCVNMIALNTETALSESDKYPVDQIVVRLTPQSKELVKENLKSLRIGDYDVDDVVVDHCADNETQQLFSDIYGRRVAFRMKGYVKTKTSGRRIPEGGIVAAGFGTVRGMGDIIESPGFEVSLPCMSPGTQTGDVGVCGAATEMPTRLKKSPYYQKFLRGVADGTRDGDNYVSIRLGSHGRQPATTVEAVHLPFERQLVVDGYICPRKFIDKDGMCTWDRTVNGEDQGRVLEEGGSGTPTAAKSSEGGDNISIKGEKEEKEEKEETPYKCPLCAYIEGGPCREQFLSWQGCIDALQTPESPEGTTPAAPQATARTDQETTPAAPQATARTDQETSTGTSSSGDAPPGATASAPGAPGSGDVTQCFPHTKAMMQCFMRHEYYDMMVAGLQDNMKLAFGDAPPAKTSPKTKVRSKVDGGDDGDDDIFGASSPASKK